MSDYLTILAAKAVNAFSPAVQPRLPSQFESAGVSFINPGPFDAGPSGEKAATTGGLVERSPDFEREAPLAHPTSEAVPAGPGELLGEAANPPRPLEETHTVSEQRIEPGKRTLLAREPQSSMHRSASDHSFVLDAEEPLSKPPSILQPKTTLEPHTGPESNSKPPGDKEAVPRHESLISQMIPPASKPLRTGRKAVSTGPAGEVMPDDIAVAEVLRVSAKPEATDGVGVDHRQPPGDVERTTPVGASEHPSSDAAILSRLFSGARPIALAGAQERVIPHESPTVRITIGRVEVRAVMQPPSPPPQVKRPSHRPTLSLEEYLKQRSAGTR